MYKFQPPSESLLYFYASKLVKLCTTYVEDAVLSGLEWQNVLTGVCLSIGERGREGDGCSAPPSDMRPGILTPGTWGLEYSTPKTRYSSPSILTHSGGHWNTYGWQVVGTHLTGMLSCIRLTTFESLGVWFAVFLCTDSIFTPLIFREFPCQNL